MFAIIIEIKVRVNKILIKFNLTVKKPNCLNEHGDRNGFLCKREVKSNERVISLNGCADRPPPNPADLCQEPTQNLATYWVNVTCITILVRIFSKRILKFYSYIDV